MKIYFKFLLTFCVIYAANASAGLIAVNAPIGGPGCDLIDAITAANNDSDEGSCSAFGTYGDDKILLSYDQILTTPIFGERNGLPHIDSNITIEGNDSSSLSNLFKIRRSDVPLTQEFRIFEVRDSGVLTLINLEVSNGSFATPVPGFLAGAGILVEGGKLVANGVLFKDNLGQVGGALHVTGDESSAKIENSSFHANRSLDAGAAISLGPTASVSIYDSTISGNYSDVFGGAIAISAFARQTSLSIYNTTITENFAEMRAGGIFMGLISDTIVDPDNAIRVRNSIISGNQNFTSADGDDIYIGEEDGSDQYPTVTFDNNVVSQSSSTLAQSVTNLFIDPSENIVAASNGNKPTPLRRILGNSKLSPKGLLYHPLVDGSPAIDAAIPYRRFGGGPPLNLVFYEPGCTGVLVTVSTPDPYRTDQRGRTRPIGTECDIGAIEYEPSQCYVTPIDDDKTVVFCL